MPFRSHLFLFLLFSTPVYSYNLDLFPDPSSKAYGNARTSSGNDLAASLINPANLSRLRKHRARFFVKNYFPNMTLGANSSTSQMFGTISGAGTSFSEAADQPAGSNYWTQIGLEPSWMWDESRQVPKLVSLGMRTQVSATTWTPEIPGATSQTRLFSLNELNLRFAKAFTSTSNQAIFGYSFQLIGRTSYDDLIETTQLNNTNFLLDQMKSRSNKLYGAKIDLGVLYTFNDFWFPTLGISMHNVPTGCEENYLDPISRERIKSCGTKYFGTTLDSDSSFIMDPFDFKLGFSIAPRMSKELAIRVATELHHIPLKFGNLYLGNKSIDVIDMVHFGFEILGGNPLELNSYAFKAGFDAGYPTVGLSTSLHFFEMHFAYYGVKVNRDIEPLDDNRFLLRLNSSF